MGHGVKTSAAVQGLADAESALARWAAEVEAKGAELASMQERAGEEALDDPDGAGAIAAAMSRLGNEQDVARRAVAAATARVQAARRKVLGERVAALTDRVARLRKAAAIRQKRTDVLLAELLEHEAATYVPYVPGPVSSGESASFKIPVTQLLLANATVLEQKAKALLVVAESGTADAVAVWVGNPTPATLATEAAIGSDGSLRVADLQRANELVRARL